MVRRDSRFYATINASMHGFFSLFLDGFQVQYGKHPWSADTVDEKAEDAATLKQRRGR